MKLLDTRPVTVALAGNPNAGKTTLFNSITGARQHVGNWPGVTVEKKEGSLRHNGRLIHVVDLPGTYSLTAYSLEEIVARNFIFDSAPDVVVDVVDASSLERNLYLTVQLLEMGAKMVVALNMVDVAEGRRIFVDHKNLSQLLGIPVVPTNGKKGVGITELLETALAESDAPASSQKPLVVGYGIEVEEELAKIEKTLRESLIDADPFLSVRWLTVKLLEGDSEIFKKVKSIIRSETVFEQVETSRKHLADVFGDVPEIVLTDFRYGFISGAMKQSVRTETTDRVHLSETIDKVLTDRFLGPIILFVVLYAVYMFTFDGSDTLVKYVDSFFKWMASTVEGLLPPGILRSLIVSGVINGVGGVLGFTPLIAFMFLAIAVLEDTGYMARIAFMLDRVLKGFGLHGASMLALMVSGGIAGGCAVPGIMATRTLKEPKERLVTILVAAAHELRSETARVRPFDRGLLPRKKSWDDVPLDHCFLVPGADRGPGYKVHRAFRPLGAVCPGIAPVQAADSERIGHTHMGKNLALRQEGWNSYPRCLSCPLGYDDIPAFAGATGKTLRSKAG